MLLAKPNEQVGVWTLYCKDTMPPPRPADAVIDKETISSLNKERRQLSIAKSDAEETGNNEEAARIAHKLSTIDAAIGKSIGYGGRTRKMVDEWSRARNSIAHQLSRTRDRIGATAPEIALHLKNSIRSIRSFGWIYQPAPYRSIRVETSR